MRFITQATNRCWGLRSVFDFPVELRPSKVLNNLRPEDPDDFPGLSLRLPSDREVNPVGWDDMNHASDGVYTPPLHT